MPEAGHFRDASSIAAARDVGIDLLRGVALVMVWIDHFEDAIWVEYLSRCTLRYWGPSDAAELFVLLSGIVVGRSLGGRISHAGLSAAWRHCWRRTGRLFEAYILSGILVLAAANWLDPRAFDAIIDPDWSRQSFAASLWQLLTLRSPPPALGILRLYLVLLPLSPLLVWWLQRRPWGLIVLSVGVYLAVQPAWSEPLSRPALLQTGWYFNPLGWQLLYVLGLWVGLRWQRSGAALYAAVLPGAGSRPGVWWGAVGLIIILGVLLRPEATGTTSLLLDQLPTAGRNLIVTLASKRVVGPLRLLHGLAVAWALTRLVARNRSETIAMLLHPLVLIGRSSLQSYALGVVLLVPAVWPFAYTEPSLLIVLMIEYDVMLVVCGVAFLRHDWDKL